MARRRLAMSLAFHSFAHVLLDQRIRISTRFKIYNASVVPNALYGSQVWPATSKELAILEVIERWMLKLDSYTSASVVIETARQVDASKIIVPLECRIRSIQLRYFGHIQRKPQEDRVRLVCAAQRCERSKPGKPFSSFRSRIHLNTFNFRLENNSEVYLHFL